MMSRFKTNVKRDGETLVAEKSIIIKLYFAPLTRGEELRAPPVVISRGLVAFTLTAAHVEIHFRFNKENG